MRKHAVEIYTIIFTAADVDRGAFQGPAEYGSFLSRSLAQKEPETQ